jgi:hypothetical protein
MRNARFLAVGLMLALLAPFPGSAQESPTVLTSREFRCQNAFGRSLLALGEGTGACLVACETTPGRRCDSFDTDPITADCLSRAQAAAQIPVLRDCAGSDCPECYSDGDCPDYTSSTFSQLGSLIDQAVQTIYCDDSFSPDGLTHAEQQCQSGLTRAAGRFIEALLHCTANCEKSVHRGTTGFSSCEAAFVDTPTFDPKTQRCIDRARANMLESCEGHCQDPPDCFDLTCSQTVALLEQEAAGLQPVTYCQEPGICGDGQVTGAEVCDSSASPSGCRSGYECSGDCRQCVPVCGDGMLVSGEFCDQSATQNGCPTGQVCEFCDFCEIPCGNGVLDPGEVCDRNAVGTCALGTACNATCDACNSTETGTEDLPGCSSFSDFDVWSFQVTAGQNVVVRADTTDFTGVGFFGNCSNGTFFSGFENLTCSNGFFSCGGSAFVTDSDASCSVTVEPSFCEFETTHYRLDVSGTDLTLVTDDGNPASPSGAFVDAPTGEVRPGA